MIKIRLNSTMKYDGGNGGIEVLCPSGCGFVNYNFVHSVVPNINCDVWRMSVVNAVMDDGKSVFPLTNEGAEWEMAIRLYRRPDFIGGFAHGDERGELSTILVDGEEKELSFLTDEKECEKFELVVCSHGFDPSAPEKVVLSHKKHFTVTEEGVCLGQEVEWLCDVKLDDCIKSYLAMMPPMKHDKTNSKIVLTDRYSFNDEDIRRIEALPVNKQCVSKIMVLGKERGITFSMKASGYEPSYQTSYDAILTDNGNHLNYHKMYIVFAGGEAENIPKGTIWKAFTHYDVELP